MLEDRIGVLAWYARVPSSSNPADSPSRGSLEGINCQVVNHAEVSQAVDGLLTCSTSAKPIGGVVPDTAVSVS